MRGWPVRGWAVRRPLTLRTRLVVALLLLSALGLAVVGAASVLVLRHSLMDRVDDQLYGASQPWIASAHPPIPAADQGRISVPTDFRIAVIERDGTVDRVLGRSPGPTGGPELSLLGASVSALSRRGPFTVADSRGGSDWRVLMVAAPGSRPDGQLIAVALSLGDTDAAVDRLLRIEIIAGAAMLAVLGVVATAVVRVGLRPLTRIELTAGAIARGELDRRVVGVDERTEAGRLGTALNTMLGRLAAALEERERSQQRLRRFVADASHELRTPLTTIRGFAELYRQAGTTEPADVTRLMARIEGEAGRMGRLVDDLLLLARMDEERPLDLAEVDLLVLAGDAVAAATARQPDRPVVLSAPHGPLRVLGDEYRLRQVITNLVGNALDHTPAGTAVRVIVDRESPSPNGCDHPIATVGVSPAGREVAVVEVADQGGGVPADQAPRLFDRFYRTDASRGTRPGGDEAHGGSGLGLAIAAAIVEAHHGRIELLSPPGTGARFRVLLPLG